MDDIKELQYIVDALVICEGKQSAAAEYCNLARSTFRDKYNKATAKGIRPSILPPGVEAKVAEVTVKHKQEIKELRLQLKHSIGESLGAETIRENIFGLLEHEASPPDWVVEDNVLSGSPGTPTLLLSDWHYGEVVNLKDMDGVNEYNIEIANKRFKTAINSTIDLCFNHMANPNYPGIVLALGGDMHSGEIHEELMETNEASTLELTMMLFDIIVWGIDALVDRFGKVFVPCAYGNHGRTGAWRSKKAAAYNHDWQLYCWLEHYYTKLNPNPNVQFQVPTAYDTRYKVHGWNYVLTHGDRLGVRGGDGIVGLVGPITRGIKKLQASYASQNREVDYVIMGHWHQRLRLKAGIVNGSGKGYDEYAAAGRFEPEIPQQCLWFTHPKYGITFETPIILEDRAERSSNWIEWADD